MDKRPSTKMKTILNNGQLIPPNPVVKKLMEFRKQASDTSPQDLKWNEKAVKSLVKKVKRTGMLDELITSVTRQESKTRCITIPRSLDGRVQVCQRKGIPHVIYCKIWRFPEIQSHHQLKPLPHCMFAYHFKKDEVCVNPYHYEKNDSAGMPPILVPKTFASNAYSQIYHYPAAVESSFSTINHLANDLYNGPYGSFAVDPKCQPGFPTFRNDDCQNSCSNRQSSSSDVENLMIELPQQDLLGSGTTCYSLPPPLIGSRRHSTASTNEQHFSNFDQQNHHNVVPTQICKLEIDTSNNVINDLPSLENSKSIYPPNITSISSPETGGCLSDDELAVFCNGGGAVAPASVGSIKRENQTNNDLLNGVESNGGSSSTNFSAVEYCEPPFWCSVNYYELNQRVGETFHASQQNLIVDGFVDPSNAERFCLGLLSNINRNNTVVEIRKHIGRGARLYVIGGEVFIECLSDHAIFVQSSIANMKLGYPENMVVKVPPECNFKIFNNREFAQLLTECVRKGFESVYSLTRMCTVRVSFVKGWGDNYRRQSVMSTPCWIELHLNGPYQWLDRVLREMRPANCVHSDT